MTMQLKLPLKKYDSSKNNDITSKTYEKTA